jgi:hypothetical protein
VCSCPVDALIETTPASQLLQLTMTCSNALCRSSVVCQSLTWRKRRLACSYALSLGQNSSRMALSAQINESSYKWAQIAIWSIRYPLDIIWKRVQAIQLREMHIASLRGKHSWMWLLIKIPSTGDPPIRPPLVFEAKRM